MNLPTRVVHFHSHPTSFCPMGIVSVFSPFLSCNLFLCSPQHSVIDYMLPVQDIKHISLSSFQEASKTTPYSWECSSTFLAFCESQWCFCKWSLWDCFFNLMPTSTPAVLKTMQFYFGSQSS